MASFTSFENETRAISYAKSYLRAEKTDDQERMASMWFALCDEVWADAADAQLGACLTDADVDSVVSTYLGTIEGRLHAGCATTAAVPTTPWGCAD